MRGVTGFKGKARRDGDSGGSEPALPQDVERIRNLLGVVNAGRDSVREELGALSERIVESYHALPKRPLGETVESVVRMNTGEQEPRGKPGQPGK